MKTVSSAGTEYPIGKILCIGRNYVDHIKELENEIPSSPVVFTKPSTSVVYNNGEVIIPPYSNNCHHEIELAVLIGKICKNISPEKAFEHIAGYGAAIDMTLRDVQDELKKKGLPWDIAKGFDTACPLSDFMPADKVNNPGNLDISLSINGELKQSGNTSLMIHSIQQLVSYLSTVFTLEKGDIILTGTPAGVGRVVSGDRLFGKISGVAEINVTVKISKGEKNEK
ncbi:MAG: fumarylacetoacetate hydrolase family protein [Desulfuromonadales bacterium]|nr:fumarylacetoacetate hydrolase family protein [Desulfuromonadales bacterium]